MAATPAPSSGASARADVGDKRRAVLDAVLHRHQRRQDALIEVLHTAQKLYGHLPSEVLWYIAEQLRLPPSRVYGVATFYNFFSLDPSGAHRLVVCEGTVCHLYGASGITQAAASAFGVAPGETSPDGRLTLDVVRCVGSCTLAPLVELDGEVLGNVSVQQVLASTRNLVSTGPSPAEESEQEGGDR